MVDFNFLEKDLGIVSPPYFVYDYILLTDQTSLSDCLYLINMCEPGCDVNLFLHDQKVKTKTNILRTKELLK